MRAIARARASAVPAATEPGEPASEPGEPPDPFGPQPYSGVPCGQGGGAHEQSSGTETCCGETTDPPQHEHGSLSPPQHEAHPQEPAVGSSGTQQPVGWPSDGGGGQIGGVHGLRELALARELDARLALGEPLRLPEGLGLRDGDGDGDGEADPR